MTNACAGWDEASRRQEVIDHLPRLQRRARALLNDSADAADLVQDTVERALRALPRLRPTSNVGAWLNRILKNHVIDWSRRADRRNSPLDEAAFAAPAPEAEPRSARWLDIPMSEINAAIDDLPPQSATILRLHIAARLSYEQISRRLGISSGAVGNRLLRARLRLRDVLIARTLACPARRDGDAPPSLPPAAPPSLPLERRA